MSIFEQASFFTLDERMKKVLVGCSNGKYPSEFKVVGGQIHTKTGNRYPIPSDPMDLYNLTHDIILGTEPAQRMATSSVVRKKPTICNDAISKYASTVGRDQHHASKLLSCIYTAIYMGYITPRDIIYSGNIIVDIKGIDVHEPSIKRR